MADALRPYVLGRSALINFIDVGDNSDLSILTNEWFFGSTTGRLKIWTGSAWVIKPVKVWTGSAWVIKPAKVWSGSAWI